MVKQIFTQVTPTLRKCKLTQVTPERSRKSRRCVKRRTKVPRYHIFVEHEDDSIGLSQPLYGMVNRSLDSWQRRISMI